jgi:hypothetical protein
MFERRPDRPTFGRAACLRSRWMGVRIPLGLLSCSSPPWSRWEARLVVSQEIRVQLPSGALPARATGSVSRCVGWAWASPGACKAPASGCAGSTPARRTDPARSSIGQDTWFSARRGGFDSRTGCSLIAIDCGWAGARPGLISLEAGFDSQARNSLPRRVGQRQSRLSERQVFVGSTPTSATGSPSRPVV